MANITNNVRILGYGIINNMIFIENNKININE